MPALAARCQVVNKQTPHFKMASRLAQTARLLPRLRVSKPASLSSFSTAAFGAPRGGLSLTGATQVGGGAASALGLRASLSLSATAPCFGSAVTQSTASPTSLLSPSNVAGARSVGSAAGASAGEGEDEEELNKLGRKKKRLKMMKRPIDPGGRSLDNNGRDAGNVRREDLSMRDVAVATKTTRREEPLPTTEREELEQEEDDEGEWDDEAMDLDDPRHAYALPRAPVVIPKALQLSVASMLKRNRSLADRDTMKREIQAMNTALASTALDGTLSVTDGEEKSKVDPHVHPTDTLPNALAYATHRMPMTFAASTNVLSQLARRAGQDWKCRRVLDFGCGPGTSTLWVVFALVPSRKSAASHLRTSNPQSIPTSHG